MAKFSYFAFVHGMASHPGEDARRDGSYMAEQCLAKLGTLDTPEQFPPKLLLLLVSSGYLGLASGERAARASQMLEGIHEAFAGAFNGEPPPLIGCSVAAVFFQHPEFENRVHDHGALLVCLASRLIDARIAVGTGARADTAGAIKNVLDRLDLDPQGEVDPNPLADKMIFAFFPGFGEASVTPAYPAPELHRLLRQGTRARIRITGGVASAGGPIRDAAGLQFAGREVLEDAVVTASLTTGIPIGTRLSHGLTPTGQIVRVKKLSADGKTIEEFEQGAPVDVLARAGEHVLLGRLSANCEPMVIVPRDSTDGRSIRFWREIKEHDFFEILKPEPGRILEASIEGVVQARNRIPIQKPVGNLMLIGNQWRLRYVKAGLDIERNLRAIEGVIPEAPSVGGFFDGQIGQDETGRSHFGNGSFASVIFGDEMRERTPMHRGFKSMAKFGARMTETSSIEGAIEEALQIVHGAGFPGAMLSLVFRDGKEKYIIAQRAIGSRFEKIVDDTRRRLHESDILSKVARNGKSEFIRDSRSDPYCDALAVGRSGIVSQYVLPLMRLDKKVVGILQVDLGNVAALSVAEKEVLDSFAATIGASINRLLNWSEAQIARKLDPALSKALTAETIQEGLTSLVLAARDAFGVEMGHVRLADHERRALIMIAGVGDCFESARIIRHAAGFDEITPICQSFKNGGTTVVNAARNDFAYREMCRNYSGHPQLLRALEKIRSYATVAFENEAKEKLGALCLISSQEWYFTSSHAKALSVLGNKMGFLVEHFRRKESEQAAQGRIHFILNSGPRLAEIKDLDDLSGELNRAVERFCNETRAQWGSLYIWDEDRQFYILRAQYGWADPNWINAARYGKEALWAGASAIDGRPVYIPDFHRHYRENGYPERYLKEAFGFIPSSEKVVEGIGIPLRVGEEQTGILTVYRGKEGAESGFTILSHPHHADQWQEIIQEGASDIAGLAFVLHSRRNEKWEKEEVRRRQRVTNAINQPNKRKSIEMRVCKMALKAYRAIRADFYKVEYHGAEKKLLWADGFCRDPKSSRITEASHLSPDKSALPIEAVRTNKIQVERETIAEEARGTDPGVAATEGLVNRACIPLVVGNGKPVGVLDLHWRVGPNQTSLRSVSHNENHLRSLGTVIGSGYLRHLIKLEAERNRFATEAAAAYSFQQSHRLGNVVQRITSLGQRLDRVASEEERGHVVTELQTAIGAANRMTRAVIELGSMVKNQFRKQHSLFGLLKNSIEGMDDEKKSYVQQGIIQLENNVPQDIVVYVDFSLTREAFINLLNNAIQAILKKGAAPGSAQNERVKIMAQATRNRRHAIISFEDTGIGMSKEMRKHAMEGFFTTQGHQGVGVLISRVLLTSQGGDLRYESEPWIGTKAIVALPLAYEGDKPKLVATLF